MALKTINKLFELGNFPLCHLFIGNTICFHASLAQPISTRDAIKVNLFFKAYNTSLCWILMQPLLFCEKVYILKLSFWIKKFVNDRKCQTFKTMQIIKFFISIWYFCRFLILREDLAWFAILICIYKPHVLGIYLLICYQCQSTFSLIFINVFEYVM